MARYGASINYGSGTNYGASAYTETGDILWQLLFDWNNDGTLDGTNEGARLTNCSIDNGRSSYLAPQGRGFEHCRPGRLTLTLENFDRRYDPRNAASALYPNIKPGRKVYLAVVDLSTNVTKVLFTGKIDDIQPVARPDGGEVQITCVDYAAQLNDQSLSLDAASQNRTLSECFGILLDDVGYPGSKLLDVDTQPVIVFGTADKNAGQTAAELADAGMGTFFVDRNGRACYYGRAHTYPTATALDQAQLLNDPVMRQPWAEVYNHITAIAHRPIKKQPSIIWFLPGPIQLSAGVPLSFDVDYSSAYDVQIKTAKAYDNADETGTARAVTATGTLGYNGGTVTVTCAANAWLTQLDIRGRQWGVVDENKVSEDAASQLAYETRRFVLDTPFLQDPNYAANHAAVILAFCKDDRESITVQIEAREDLQFLFDLMTPVALTIAKYDIDATYYVMGLRHEWARGAQGVVTSLDLARIIADSTAVTAANVLNEPKEAPQGYEDPGGDPDTIESDEDARYKISLYEEGGIVDELLGVDSLDFVGAAITATISDTIPYRGIITVDVSASVPGAIYSQISVIGPALHQYQIGTNMVRWGSDSTNDLSNSLTVDNPYFTQGMTLLTGTDDWQLQVDTAGVYYVEFWTRLQYTVALTGAVANLCELVQLRSGTAINSAGTTYSEINLTSLTKTWMQSAGLFSLAEDDTLAAILSYTGTPTVYCSMRAFCIKTS